MNRIYRSICNLRTGTFIAVSENARSAGKKSSLCNTMGNSSVDFALKTLAASLLVVCSSSLVYAQPVGGVVSAGNANISTLPGNMTIQQNSQNVAINWQSFNINRGESVNFVQPNSSAIALNRVLGSDASSIMGNLSANGKVFLINPNGVLFGKTASVNVGGLVASTLNISDADFMANNYKFSGTETGTVLNQGSINTTDGGYVALLGANVSNQGVIAAQLGTVALAAGKAMTLDVAGDKLLNIVVNQDVVNALVENGGVIQANGGQVLMTTQTAGSLLANAVNNTGVIQAQTIQNVKGTIKLLAGMQNGSTLVAGTMDASAPTGSSGGFIETSAAKVRISDTAKITTVAPLGQTGTWLIDPQDFNVGGDSTDNISGATLSALLVTNSVIISTLTGPNTTQAGTPPQTNLNTAIVGNGDINIKEAVSWSASSSPTTLTLRAERDVNINQAVTATNGNFEVCCGRDINVDAPITTTRGSILLAAGRDINLNAATTTTDGNITFCAEEDIHINEKITLTRGTTIPGQSLGLPLGLVLSAGYGANKPGIEGGTVIFAPLAPPITVTGPNAPVTINYNPVSYTAPTDYAKNFVLTDAKLTQHMLVYATGGDKTFDGSNKTTLSGLIGNPSGLSLVAGPNSTATFNDAAIGTDKTITFDGYSLSGLNAGDFALAADCCTGVRTTTGTISAVVTPPVNPPVVVPPVVVPPVNPPVVVPPVVVPPVNPPVVVPPVVIAPVIQPTPPGVVPPAVVRPVIQPTPPGKLPPVIVVPPLLTVLPPAELPSVDVSVPPVAVPPKTVVIKQPPVTYVPPVYLPKQDRN
ncbi:two-partner secretion domain-containing protein [Acinetobacter terrestris]|uniref:Filamentous hemagglutinin N-terminal domain-containing protein n=1 Tax=Acinetobacter terrestris TaxID=2529843 RepID=A0ABX1UXB7_9GAMM|nr:filamentous hemagglutinin N-terminal domain-containing protein [Acinetobacter terrestris]NNH27872.1 filamentous hemagglutinin N-terminal domain-containing protein [Acinetobacter terrestris]